MKAKPFSFLGNCKFDQNFLRLKTKSFSVTHTSFARVAKVTIMGSKLLNGYIMYIT